MNNGFVVFCTACNVSMGPPPAQKPCPNCGQPMPGSTPAQPAAFPVPVVAPAPVAPIKKANETWRDRPSLL